MVTAKDIDYREDRQYIRVLLCAERDQDATSRRCTRGRRRAAGLLKTLLHGTIIGRMEGDRNTYFPSRLS